MTNIGEICSREVIVVTREMGVPEAAKLMRRHHVGTLVVCEELGENRRKPVGIVTDRDLVLEVLAQDLKADTLTVGDIMVQELVTASETDGVRETLELMRTKGVRRAPITGADGRLIGLLSIDDLLDAMAGDLTDIARIIARGQSREAATRK